MKIEELKHILEKEHEETRGTYRKAIILYALELVENIGDHYTTTQEQRDNIEKIDKQTLKALALNGADSWEQYSWGGCSFVYSSDILNVLFCPSIAKKYENAEAVGGVHLLDRQAHALARAFSHILYTIKRGA